MRGDAPGDLVVGDAGALGQPLVKKDPRAFVKALQTTEYHAKLPSPLAYRQQQ